MLILVFLLSFYNLIERILTLQLVQTSTRVVPDFFKGPVKSKIRALPGLRV